MYQVSNDLSNLRYIMPDSTRQKIPALGLLAGLEPNDMVQSPLMDSKTATATNPVVFTVIIPWTEVQAAYNTRLDELTAKANIKGFRPGKAPRPMVEEQVGKKAIYSDIIEKVLPPAYQKEVAGRNLKPVISPRVKPLVLEENKDWQFEIAVVIKPEVNLPELDKKLAEALAAGKIVIPGKQEEQTRDQKMRLAFDTVLKTTEVDLPQLLIDEEVNARLGQLIDQLQAVGMTVEQYMQTKNLDVAKLRSSYETTARDMLKLNFALDKIASDQHFEGKDRIAKAVDWLISH